MANNKLTRQQKEAVGLLSIGTFLEYFDLMLYVHMSVLLNELFFPQTNPTTAKLLGVTAFCLTFVFRPVGGFIIGKIGDIVGRKHTIMATTFIMALTCLTMALIPTYKEIGILATVIVIICRGLQGISSLGEGMGALIYITESLKQPYRYIAIGIIDIFSMLGSMTALIVSFLATSSNYGWRVAFFVGAIIASVGFIARTRLRETADFTNYKKRMVYKSEVSNSDYSSKCNEFVDDIDKKNIVRMFFSIFAVPLSFYVSYIYLGDFMIEKLEMKPAEVMMHNLALTILCIIAMCVFAYLCKKYHPLRMLKLSYIVLVVAVLLLPYCLENIIKSSNETILLFLFQFLLHVYAGTFFNEAIYLKSIPIRSRFTIIGAMFGIGTAIGYAVTSYGLIYLTKWFGYYGIWALYAPVIIGVMWGMECLKKLEVKNGRYHNYPHEDPPEEDTAIDEEDYDYEDLGDEYEPFTHRCEYTTNLMNKLDESSKEKNIKLNMKLIEKAMVFAKRWHGTQMRKTGDHPYYWHPLMVAEMVAERYLKTDIIIGAILHDTVEDSDCTVELVEEKFNKRIAEMVDRLTKKRFENGKHIKLTLEQTLDKLQKLGDNEALFVKQMDRQHNLETIEGLNPEKQRKMAEESRNYFVRLVAIIGDKLNIYGKIHLENKMFKSCCDILRKKK